MKFLLDENIGKKVAYFLQSLDYHILRVRQFYPGIPDDQILKLAISKKAILITSDKDFGELIFKKGQSSTGVIFLRLQNESSINKIKALKEVLHTSCLRNKQACCLRNKFITVKEKGEKFAIRVNKIISCLSLEE